RIAVGATTSLVAWEDFSTTTDFTNRVRGTRVARDGTVLDPGGVGLAAHESNENQLKMASSGDRFLVAWRHEDPVNFVSSIHGSLGGEAGAAAPSDLSISPTATPTL